MIISCLDDNSAETCVNKFFLMLNSSNLFNKDNLIWQFRPLTLPNVSEWSWNWTTIPLPSFLGHEHFLTETGFNSSHNGAKVFKPAALLRSKRSFLYPKSLSVSFSAPKFLGSWAFSEHDIFEDIYKSFNCLEFTGFFTRAQTKP